MKLFQLIVLTALVCAAPAVAQDRIELYADREGTSCAISEPVSPPVVQVHVFISGPVGATGARFTARKPDCWVGATWLGDAMEPGVVTVAHSQYDWSIAFGGCTVANTATHLGAISYLISGQALPCCEVSALPGPYFEFVDCGYAQHPLEETRSIVVNPDESCGCRSGVTLATESTTWGHVKSLYR